MKRLASLISVLALIIIGYLAWTEMFPKPEQAIRKRLKKLARLASFPANQGNFARIANVQKLGLLFSEDVQVLMEGPDGEARTISFNRRDELMQAALAAKRFASGLKAEFSDVYVKIDPDQESAIADVVLQAKISGERDMIEQELKFSLKNTNGDWLITRIEPVKSLKP